MTAAQARTRGREFFDQRAWGDAFAELSAADREVPLEPEDVGRLATAAYLLGRDDDSVELWERAHQEQLSAGDVAAAARYAGWLVFVLLNGGEFARAGGWLARARRLLDDGEHDDCAEQGHLLVPLALQRAVAGARDPRTCAGPGWRSDRQHAVPIRAPRRRRLFCDVPKKGNWYVSTNG